MNISFTKKQEEYIAQQVATGEYQNNSEVIRDALRLHKIYREKVIDDLRRESRKVGTDRIVQERWRKLLLQRRKGD